MFSKKNIARLYQTLFRNRRNLIVLVIASMISYGLLAIFSNIGLLLSAITGFNFSLFLSLLFNIIVGFSGTLSAFNHFFTILLSILMGFNFALIFASLSNSLTLNRSQSGSIFGMLFAPAVSVCSVCVTAISFAGFSISVALLPFGGLELTFLAAIMLIVSAFWIIEKNYTSTCSI